MTTLERRAPSVRSAVRPVAVFALIGVGTSVVHLGLFALLRAGFPAQASNAVALAIATVVNTSANRRWTFGVTGRAGAGWHQVQGFLVFGLTLVMTSGGLWLLHTLWPGPPRWIEIGTIAVATVSSTAVKYLLMKSWMFGRSPEGTGRTGGLGWPGGTGRSGVDTAA